MWRRFTAISVVLLAGLFVFLHTGSRGVHLCEEEGFGGPGTLSLWPPGTRCVGGEPQFEVTMFNDAFILGLVLIPFVVFVAVALLSKR